MAMNEKEIRQVDKDPKIDLHLHLDGALSGEAIMSVAQRHGVTVPGISEQSLDALSEVYPDFGPFHASSKPEFDRFLALFGKALSVMQKPETIHDSTLEVIRDLKRQNVVYAELRFAPNYHCREGHSMNEMVEAVLRATREGERETGVVTRLIVVVPREIEHVDWYKGPSAKEIVKTALEFQDQGVVAIDLACSEHFGPEPYIDLFRSTFGERLQRTVHAGETGPQMQQNIKTALYQMGANGLGHARGLPSMLREMYFVRQNGVRVERAPISNQCMVVGEDFDRVDELLERGILVSVNSDDPGIFGPGCSLAKNLVAVGRKFHFGLNGVRELTLNAARSAFLPMEEKKALEERVSGGW
ncbi:MAG: hypothetical protein WC651_05315 [Candidatus Gracilibacteria bacterium]|jgi:adenosine deaminase